MFADKTPRQQSHRKEDFILSASKRNPTMADVARRAGVSAMTVSRALKGTGLVTEETHKKIMEAVDELGYVLDLTAGSLSSQKSGFVSVLIPSVNNSNFSETLLGVTDILDKAGKQVLLGYTGYNLKREEQLIEAMLQRRPEGLILTGGEHSARARKILENTSIPIIETWDLPQKPINHVVGFSNAATIEDMVARLVFCGYRHIAYIGGNEKGDFRGIARRQGFEHAITTLGLPKAHVVSVGDPPISIEQGAAAVVRLIEEWPEVEAVICVSDPSAFGAIMECHRRNIPVPQRLAVAGFGDFEISRFCWPSITTISVNCYEIGQSAGNLVLKAIEAKDNGEKLPPQTIRMPHSVIERESTKAR